jgi:hypothetical protein
MPAVERKTIRRFVFLLFAGLTLAQTGCLLALAGLAAGAGATGYFYCKGRIYRDFNAPLPAVRNAVHAALVDMHFANFTEEAKDGKALFVTKTTNGKKVRIYLDSLPSPIPAEGVLTRLSIRVGAFGDESTSGRLFKQVEFRLTNPAPVESAPPGPPPIGAPTPIQQTGFQTTEPRIAPTPAPKEK